MLRGEIPPQVSNHRRALLSLGPVLAERSFRRALLSPCTFLTGHFYREAFALPLSLAWCRILCHAALQLARHFVWTPAQRFWTDRASLLGCGERVGRSAVITPAGGSPLR